LAAACADVICEGDTALETGPLNRISMTAPATADAAQESMAWTREFVAAIRRLNKTELLERGREMRMRRSGPGRRPVVDVIDLETGEAIDELSSEEVLSMAESIEEREEL
jgi:uncharacterized FlaG/YvyC family protein